MSETSFDTIQAALNDTGAEAALETLVDQLGQEKKYHDLFDARLMLSRYRLGLPVISSSNLDDLPEPVRTQTEDAYLEACREVGKLLLEAGRFREAWMYLRPTGDKEAVAQGLLKAEPNDETLEEIIEVALHEGVAPACGFRLVLENYGTCNAITTFESALPQQAPEAQREAAEMLVRHLHEELLTNVRSHVEDRKEGVSETATLKELVSEHEWIFENDNYHVDTSHLASVVRFARLVDDPEVIGLARELTEYGRRLSEQYRFAGEPPFEEPYTSHGLLFSASLDEQVDEAVDYFRNQAETVDIAQEGTAAVETYLILLTRLGRDAEALEALAKLTPESVQLSGYAPKMIEMAQKCGAYDRFIEICRQRGDLLSFAAGLVEAEKISS